jgi:hypothetical protein
VRGGVPVSELVHGVQLLFGGSEAGLQTGNLAEPSKPSEWVCWSGIEVPVSAVGRRDEDLAVADLPFAHARLGSN